MSLLNDDCLQVDCQDEMIIFEQFDQVKKEYIYRVNENVGVQQANGTPYQIQIGARYAF